MNKTSKSRTYPSPSVKKPSTSSSSTFNAVEVGRKSVDILVKKKLQRKQEWNDYLTEDNQFRITQEELLKKKQLLVSKHNILSEQYQPPKLKTKVKQLKTKIQHLTTNHQNTKEKDHTHTTTRVKLREEHQQHEKERGEQSTSLDLLELDSDEETEEDEISSDYDHIHHQSRPQSVRKHSNIADRSSSPVNHASTVRNLPFKPAKHQKSSQKKKFFTTTEKIPDDDLSNISKELILLFQELRYYEELSGKRSILQTDELMELLPEDELLSDQLDQKKVIRLLVNLVCQTMTYLLKNEVERATLSSEMELLKEKFHELQVSVLTRNTTTMPVFTSQPSLFSQQPPVTTHTTQTLPPPTPLATSSQPGQMMIEDGHNIITTPSISPIIPSSQHLPSDLMNRYLNISAMTSSPAVTNDDKSRAIPSSDGMVRRNLEMQFQSFETSSATPQRASTAANTTTATPIQSTPTTNKFTGSSPTDLLFSPNALSKFQQKSSTPSSNVVPPPQPSVTSSTPPSALKVTSSDATVNKRTVDFNTTPLPSYQHADVSDFSTRTQDLLVSEYDHERVVRGYGGEADEEEEEVEEEEANNSFDYEAVMKLKNKYLMSMRDSTESTIERLSQQYANTLTHNSATHHQHQGKMREEQPSVGGPNVDIPMPVQAPQHPFAMTHRASAKDGKLHPMKNSSGLAVMPLLSEKRVHDVRNVSF